MEFLPEASQPRKYRAFLNEDGEKYIVLEGLDENVIHDPGVLETFLHLHYDFFEGMYWILLFVSLFYVCMIHVVLPLYLKLKSHPALVQLFHLRK